MSPLNLAGAGWLLSTLGLGGFLGGIGGWIAVLGHGVMAYGLQHIRWRNDWFGRAFWLTVVALVLILTLLFQLFLDRAQIYTLTLTQAAIAFTVARGVSERLVPAGRPTGKMLALTITSVVVTTTTVAIVVLDILVVAGAGLPSTPLAVLLLLSGLSGIVFGVLLLTLSREPALQAGS
ncbi:MAG: hypothetical protein H0V13_00555 [Nocardioidaceae bacterium]|nr:hypothetical protein [Nocardioidaceae bacterium]